MIVYLLLTLESKHEKEYSPSLSLSLCPSLTQTTQDISTYYVEIRRDLKKRKMCFIMILKGKFVCCRNYISLKTLFHFFYVFTSLTWRNNSRDFHLDIFCNKCGIHLESGEFLHNAIFNFMQFAD